jgi:hypothetical protein
MTGAPLLEDCGRPAGARRLLVEAFATKLDKRSLAITPSSGSALVLVATFFLPSPPPAEATGFWSVLHRRFARESSFKRFALVTTILVLIMMIDYAPARASDDPRRDASCRARRVLRHPALQPARG